MAAPIVAATAALARALNPDARAADVIRVIKQTASRPVGAGWSPELGWGILNAGAALTAMTGVDRRPPVSKLRGPARVRQPRAVKLRWSGSDRALPRLQSSGIDHFDVYRSTNRGTYKRIKRTTNLVLAVRMRAGQRYRFYTIAVDRAGNREAVPPKPDLSTRVDARR
jgi:hypothetical protein